MVPENWEALKIALLFFIPGILVLEIQRFFVPAHFRSDFELGARSLVHGSVNYVACWGAMGPFDEVSSKMSLALVFFLFAPILQGIAWGVVTHGDFIGKGLSRILNHPRAKAILPNGIVITRGYGEVWDQLFSEPQAKWLRIHTKAGSVYEGQTQKISSFPDDRQLFIKKPSLIGSDGLAQNLNPRLSGILFRADEISHIEVLE